MFRRSLCLLVPMFAVAATLAVSASAATAEKTPTGPAKVVMRTTKLGPILTNSRGHTLYAFTKDGNGMDNCVTTPGCAFFWPPLLTTGAPTAGFGVNASLLGTIMLPSGQNQVTYDGHPLYTYLYDFFPRMTGYVGITAFGGTWQALTVSGMPLS